MYLFVIDICSPNVGLSRDTRIFVDQHWTYKISWRKVKLYHTKKILILYYKERLYLPTSCWGNLRERTNT